MKRLYILLSIFVLIVALFVAQRLTLSVQEAGPSPSPTVFSSTQPTVAHVEPSLLPAPIPSPTPTLTAKASSAPSPTSSTIAAAVSLKVPFTIQAPDGQWIEPWKEGCEEAALLMADAYNKGNRDATLPVAETKTLIQKMVDWQVERFGSHRDIGIDEMAIVAKEYMGYSQVRVKHGATLEDIRNELRNGKPVIIPAAGRLLGNPYFTSPGPIYHVLLLKGFDGETFIANENGTRHGNGYVYTNAILEKAIHDYRPGADIVNGDLAYLVLER